MFRKIIMVLFFAALTCIVSADEVKDTGKKITEKFGNSVVTVKLVMENKMVVEGRESGKKESKSDIIGTVISKDGLTLCSLGASDPSEIFSQFEEQGEQGQLKFSYESKITDVKIRFASGEEVPGEVVLRDKDLDLLFIKPTKTPSSQISYIDLSDSEKTDVLDNVFIVNRLGQVANWTVLISVGRITGIMEKPRLYYIPEESLVENLGNPVFAAGGKIVGIVLLRKFPGKGFGAGSLLEGIAGFGLLPVILPAKDILEIQNQISPKKIQ